MNAETALKLAKEILEGTANLDLSNKPDTLVIISNLCYGILGLKEEQKKIDSELVLSLHRQGSMAHAFMKEAAKAILEQKESERVILSMTLEQASELGLVLCKICGHPSSDHFMDQEEQSCAICANCPSYEQKIHYSI